ncbi:MAG: helix-turn-helix transcriptional regulator [Actinomycetota bacterium]|nr:helix-turn-helix transcriptional regulator [Actinomycetota bacterium]
MKGDGTKGHLDLVLLGVLAAEPGHGYSIIGALKARTGGVLDLPEGSVYPALHRLEDRGLIASEWKPVGGRRRREYRLTHDGASLLASERREWARLAGAINAVLAIAPPHAGPRVAGGLA